MRDLTTEYPKSFFACNFVDHGIANFVFAKVLRDIFKPSSVIDFGCGIAETLLWFKINGLRVKGVEGSSAALDLINLLGGHIKLPNDIIITDLEKPIKLDQKFDLAISIETLEHITPNGADVIVNSICQSANAVVVTACPPQNLPNPHHFNEQPFGYWINKFLARGFLLGPDGTNTIKARMDEYRKLNLFCVPMWFVNENLGYFYKSGKDK